MATPRRQLLALRAGARGITTATTAGPISPGGAMTTKVLPAAAFGTTSSSSRDTSYSRTPRAAASTPTSTPAALLSRSRAINATPRGLGGPTAGRTGIRWSSSSSSATGSKIWTFEEISALTSSSSPGSHPQVTLIDVREPSELAATGRIPGSANVPIASAPDSFHMSDGEFEARHGFPRPARGAEVVFYCKAGVRSRAAAGIARDAGWAAVGEYPGSWAEWVARGGKVER